MLHHNRGSTGCVSGETSSGPSGWAKWTKQKGTNPELLGCEKRKLNREGRGLPSQSLRDFEANQNLKCWGKNLKKRKKPSDEGTEAKKIS